MDCGFKTTRIFTIVLLLDKCFVQQLTNLVLKAFTVDSMVDVQGKCNHRQ
jgi:hypothetical protein